MRAYWLHDAAWSRVLTQRVRRPQAIRERLRSRRRRVPKVGADGRLLLIAADVSSDPRSGTPVSRRELLDRLIEALSVERVDGVMGPADVLEDLTVLNVLEGRLAVRMGSGPGFGRWSISSPRSEPGRGDEGAPLSETHSYDAAAVPLACVPGSPPGGQSLVRAQRSVARMAGLKVPSLVNISIDADHGREYEQNWQQWLSPVHGASSAFPTGAGLWLSIPALIGLTEAVGATGFPVLLRDTDVPLPPSAWVSLFESTPRNVRGLIGCSSALFPLTGSVGQATEVIADAIHRRS